MWLAGAGVGGPGERAERSGLTRVGEQVARLWTSGASARAGRASGSKRARVVHGGVHGRRWQALARGRRKRTAGSRCRRATRLGRRAGSTRGRRGRQVSRRGGSGGVLAGRAQGDGSAQEQGRRADAEHWRAGSAG
jgi:hypothetical protein